MPRALPSKCSLLKTQSNGAQEQLPAHMCRTFVYCTTQRTECRWRGSFEAAQGRLPSAGDMVSDAHVVAMLKKRRLLQGEWIARARGLRRKLTRLRCSETGSSQQASLSIGGCSSLFAIGLQRHMHVSHA